MEIVYVVVLLAVVTSVVLVMLWQTMKRLRMSEQELVLARETAVRLETELNAERRANDETIKLTAEQYRREIDSVILQHEEMRRMLLLQADERLKAMKLEFENLSKSHLKLQEESLKSSNKENVESLLAPLRETIMNFSTAFTANKQQQVETKTTIENLIKNLLQKTDEIGHNADELTKALKADPKKQGNWGEAVLKNILEASGMEDGREFETQTHTTDENGRRLIPDVVVHLPEKRNIIIDSKVSLTAYTAYMTSDNEREREQLLKEHIISVRRHVKELASKQYQNVVKNSIGYVLMFIPNEGSYILAMENDTKLATDAYRDHIIILNPTNLMMALQLVYHLWQSERQTKNVEEIYNSAVKLYDKFVTFSDNYLKLGQQIETMTKTYNESKGQLTDGRGNIVHQLEQWKQKGLVTTKQISPALTVDSVDGEEDKL